MKQKLMRLLGMASAMGVDVSRTGEEISPEEFGHSSLERQGANLMMDGRHPMDAKDLIITPTSPSRKRLPEVKLTTVTQTGPRRRVVKSQSYKRRVSSYFNKH